MKVRDSFREQGRVCGRMGSPFMEQLLSIAAERLTDETDVGARLLGWSGDPTPFGDATALRFAAGLHAVVLQGYGPLAEVYPPQTASDEVLWSAVALAMETQSDVLHAWLDRPPQTNEPRRSAALALGLAHLAARGLNRVTLLELGASAGVNLMVDHIAVDLGDQRIGADEPALVLSPKVSGQAGPLSPYEVLSARGCDQTPLLLRDARDQVALLSYTWPDQPERQARLRTLFEVAARDKAPQVDRADAALWLEQALDQDLPPGVVVIWHSVFWQYPPRETQDALRHLITEAGARGDRPLAWLRLEPDDQNPGAAITLDLWPGGGAEAEHTVLARSGYHGEWLAF